MFNDVCMCFIKTPNDSTHVHMFAPSHLRARMRPAGIIQGVCVHSFGRVNVLANTYCLGVCIGLLNVSRTCIHSPVARARNALVQSS
jgi:hypothetical protein